MNKQNIGKLLKDNVVLIALIILIVVMAVITDSFLTLDNISNIFTQIAIYGIVAFAMTIAIICGEFDLSCGALRAVITILFTDIAKNQSVGLAVLVCLAVGIAVGLINGFMVAKSK